MLGVRTPPFDGIVVTVASLEATPAGFRIEVDVRPGLLGWSADLALGVPTIAWWARDDRGNFHLGEMGGWSGDGDRDTGEIEFSPGIDPKATRLDLLPTADTERAVIRVALELLRVPG